VARYSLGTVTLGGVERMEGWTLRQTAQRVSILASGESTYNEIIQQGSTPRQDATISGTITTESDADTLRAYQETLESVDFYDPTTDDTIPVRVFGLSLVRQFGTVYDYRIVLIREP
jgi:hypothetical protein